MEGDIREKLVQFSPKEQMSPEVTQMVRRTIQSQSAMEGVGKSLFELTVPVISFLGACGIVASYSPVAALTLVVFTLPYIYHSRAFGRERLNVENELLETRNRFGMREWSMLSGETHLEMKLYRKIDQLLTHLKEERKKFDDRALAPTLVQNRRNFWVQPLNSITISLIGATVLGDAIWGLMNPGSASISIGQYGFILGALYSLNGAVRAFSSTLGTLVTDFPTAKIAHGIMKRATNGERHQSSKIQTSPAVWSNPPEIKVTDLHFSYPPTKKEKPEEVLKGISFCIRPGELLGIVGESASGKTTLVNLLSGIYDAPNDAIAFDGRSLSEIPRSELWHNSAYLRQQSANPYSMTVRENIRIGEREPLTDKKIMELAEQTGFREEMDKHDVNLDTVLGQWFEGGTNLSGGQHTLLALTRLAAANGRFAIFDEPTAALDQRRAQSTLERVREMEGVTRIVISHDYGIARNADRILVLDDGKVADIGSHDQLLERCEQYRAAYEKQLRRLTGSITQT